MKKFKPDPSLSSSSLSVKPKDEEEDDEEDDEEDEEEEELAVNHSGMWNFREFGRIWGNSVPFPV